jgi:prolyl-tRNA synthetase
MAPTQVVVVPIYKNDEEKRTVMEATERLTGDWKGNIRFKVDDRDNLTPGFKYNEWELKGIPVRVEIGPRDVKKESVAVARRDIPGKEGKQFVLQAGLTDYLVSLLEEIQSNLFTRALKFREERTRIVTTYDELREAVEVGFARCYWAGTTDDEKRIQDELKATIRVIPFDQPDTAGTCVLTGKETTQQVVFARAY